MGTLLGADGKPVEQATLEQGAGDNPFNHEVARIMEKHKVKHSILMHHPGGETFNAVGVLYMGDPSIEWIVTAFENFCKEVEERRKKGILASSIAPAPEADPELLAKAIKANPGVEIQ